jgi:hypothetical protein
VDLNELDQFPDVEAFYRFEPRAERSGESDYGVWWRDDDGGVWRVSYVHDTGHVYAVRLGGVRSDFLRLGAEEVVLVSAGDEVGPVVILGRIAPRPWRSRRETFFGGRRDDEPAEEALKGWTEECGQQGSLAWALARVQAAEAAYKRSEANRER